MQPPPTHRLLAFARELQRAATFTELLSITQAEIKVALGYQHTWLFVGDDEYPDQVRLLDFAGSQSVSAWETTPVLKVKGDAMLEEILRSDAPVVVEDARTDPRTNKEIVAALGNRTIINVPLRMLDAPFGAFGTGTFGDEGVKLPSEEGLAYLVGMGGQLAVAAGRIRFLEERRRAGEALSRTEEQLRQAQKMEAIGRLAGGVAHDFNNLLSVILSYSTMALDSLKPVDPLRQDIEAIRRAGERAAELTHQLLAFSRKQVLEPRVLDLNAIVIETEKMLRRLIGEDIELVTNYDPELPKILVDPGQMDQVVMNLVVNARDAMPRGGKLTVETRAVMLDETYASEHFDVTPGPYAMLAVSDTGEGMDKATQARIYEPFFTTKDHLKGTGLGLSTVFGIIKQSGGTIWVYSEPGEGATFRVYLPQANEELDTVRERPRSPVSLNGSETILLAEDEDDVRMVAAEVLKRHGYYVLEARNAGEALLLCESHPLPIHLLISDVVMPRMGGRELASRLLQLRPELRVLYMSGYTDGTVVPHGILDPGVHYLQKPIVPATLARRVREVLESPRSSPPPAR